MNHWLAGLGAIGVLTLLLAVSVPLPAEAAEVGLQALREQAEHLQREARELKAEGKADQAQEVMRQVEELRAQAARLREPAGPAGPDQPRVQELKRQLERNRAELKELRAAGKTEEALKLERRIEGMETALERFGRPPGDRVRPQREPRPGRDLPGVPSGTPEMQRLRHLEVAIENLHAAGLHEPAESLSQQAREMRQHLGAGDRPGFAPRPPEGDLERLQMELQELRQAVRELNARLDQLNRARR